MATSKSNAWMREGEARRSARAWALAARQHGMLSRRDLLALGFSPAAIKHRVATGRLHPVMRGTGGRGCA